MDMYRNFVRGLNDILKYDLGDVIVNHFRRAMSNVVKGLYDTDECLSSQFVDTVAAL
jgi:hypothetical protein